MFWAAQPTSQMLALALAKDYKPVGSPLVLLVTTSCYEHYIACTLNMCKRMCNFSPSEISRRTRVLPAL